MKRILVIAATAAFSLLSMISFAKDDSGHTLTALWKAYYAAESADKPKEQLEVLEKIKKEAKAQKLAWDYYDACETYVRVSTYRNWKLQEARQQEFREEIESFPVPVAEFYMKRYEDNEALRSFMNSHKEALLKGRNPEFWTRDYLISGCKFSDALIDLISNDYEYALWHMRNNAREEFDAHYGDSYPQAAMAAYFDIRGLWDREERFKALCEFSFRYSGKAVALLAIEDALEMKFNDLSSLKTGSSDDFKSLRATCESFLHERDAFSGEEKKIASCCTIPEDIIRTLDDKKIGFRIENSAAEVYLENLPSFTFRIIADKKTVFEKKAENPAQSYYVTDTVRIDLPDLDDGEYEARCFSGKTEARSRYYKYTLSAAFRRDASGYSVFVADYLSGEPLPEALVTVEDKDGNIKASCPVRTSRGFAPLSGEVSALLADSKTPYMVYVSANDASGRKRLSNKYKVYMGAESPVNTDESAHRCMLITDRAAFTPDETVHFKVIMYSGVHDLKACGAGIKLQASLSDAEGRNISETNLVTGESGSAAGEFLLKRGKRNGMYTIRIYEGDRVLQTAGLRVDDFVLPTYDLVWDVEDFYYFPQEEIEVKGSLRSYSGHNLASADVTFHIFKNGEEYSSGKLDTDSKGNFVLEVKPDQDKYQNYRIEVDVVDATGETKSFQRAFSVMEKPVRKSYYFEEAQDNAISVKIVAGKKRTWAVAELYGVGNVLLESRLLDFSPEGDAPASAVAEFEYKDYYPDAVTLHILYYQNSDSFEHRITRRRPDTRYDLPLSFSRFLDTTLPGSTYRFTVKTAPGVECSATIYDKSTESIMSNCWTPLRAAQIAAPSPRYQIYTGMEHAYSPVFAYGTVRMVAKSAAAPMMANSAAFDTDSAVEMEEEAIPFQMADEAPVPVPQSGRAEGYVRENFANTIVWMPFIRSDADGEAQLEFKNADKLSTYYVQVFAFDPSMRNASIRREMTVTLPVKVAVVQPQYLYEGDGYTASATFSNSKDEPVSGTAEIIFLRGSDYESSMMYAARKEQITVPADGAADLSFAISCPQVDSLGILVRFTCDNAEFGSDALFTSVPVYKAEQTLIEAHSAVLLAGADRDALISVLKSAFVNIPGDSASVKEISIRDMLLEAIPEKIEVQSENLISLLDAYYAGYLLEKMGRPRMSGEQKEEILAKIKECRKADGGYAWFKDMESSPVITAVALERFFLMGMVPDDQTVRYLDSQYFTSAKRPYWNGSVNMAQYAYVRSLYPDVPFDAKGADRKALAEFRKAFRQYLVPASKRGLNGMILAKALRMKTLLNLTSGKEGLALAKGWGVRLLSSSRMSKSLMKDTESLVQYAQEHKSGGCYFPNAVLPWRGLMESELYAHTLLCGLLEKQGHQEIADGIRLWFMIQKETQQWHSDPAYIQALGMVLAGPEKILQTKVVALEGTFSKPFGQIEATGNGISIERKYFLGDRELHESDILKVGDKVRAEYHVRNDENRSFVVLRAPRPALLRPVRQLSGYERRAYRSVLAASTEYWYEVFPEGSTVVTEEFYVTQQGSFRSPVSDIECLYAPHYRANDAGGDYTLESQ